MLYIHNDIYSVGSATLAVGELDARVTLGFSPHIAYCDFYMYGVHRIFMFYSI